MFSSIPAWSGTEIYAQMLQTRRRAVTEKTEINKQRQYKKYFAFCLMYGVAPLHPTIDDVCIFIQHLASIMKSPATVRNYTSGAHHFVISLQGADGAFNARLVKDMLNGVVKISTHVPSPAPPITPAMMMALARYFDCMGVFGVVVKATLLIGYFTFLRGSNMCVNSPWEPGHGLLRRDITPSPGGLLVTIRSSKTTSAKSPPMVLPIQAFPPGTPHCPVAAYMNMLHLVPALPHSPAFVWADTQLPVTAPSLQTYLRRGLFVTGVRDAAGYSLHGMRRGAAHAAAEGGAKCSDVKNHGLWKSDAVYRYAPKEAFSSVPSALAASFGP